ncbi:hypothetical protein HDU67_009839 [Dinochytrium kinnereticum]|nr:hypothetical protein HDU67_009839 [Dinochytrium kinnereticum]
MSIKCEQLPRGLFTAAATATEASRKFSTVTTSKRTGKKVKTPNASFPENAQDRYSKLTVENLRQKMRSMGITTNVPSPRKADLIDALLSALERCRALRSHLQTSQKPAMDPVLSIDVGMVNLGYILLQPSSPFAAGKTARVPNVLQWGVKSLFDEESKAAYDPASLAVATSTLIDVILQDHSFLTSVVIERQHWSFRTATAIPVLRCAAVEASLFGTVRERLRQMAHARDEEEKFLLTTFEAVPPRSVAVHFDLDGEGTEAHHTPDAEIAPITKPNRRYRNKKKMGVAVVSELVGEGSRINVPGKLLTTFEKMRKKDDASDALLLGLASCEWQSERFRELSEFC